VLYVWYCSFWLVFYLYLSTLRIDSSVVLEYVVFMVSLDVVW
jgi:hypothetical protein